MKMRWMAAVVVGLVMAAGSAWADKRLDDAVSKAEEQLRKAKDLRDKSPDEADRAIQDAIKTIQKVADQDAQNPEARLALARILLRAGKRDDAGTAFARAVELAPAAAGPMRAQAFAALADYELTRGSNAKALTAAETAVKAEASAANLALLARAQARVADPALALQTVERALQAGPTVAAAHEAKGVALLALGRTPEAVVSLRKAVELGPTVASAQIALAIALLQQNNAAAALEAARAATKADPQSAEALAVQGLAAGKANPGEWGAAIGDAQQGAFLDAKSPLVQWAVGQLFEQNNNYEQAITAYQASVAIDPGFCPAAAGLVQTTYRTGRDTAAMPWAQKLAPANPFCGGVQLTYGEMLLRKDDYAKALPALEKAAKLLPDSADANYFLGLAYTYQGKIPEAVVPYRRAVELNQAALGRTQETDKAIEQLKRADLDYRTAYGLALGRAQEIDDAIKELQSVVKTPGYNKSDAWINLGYVLRMARRAPEAIEAYQKALSIDPKSAPAALGLALSLGQAKRCDEAVPAFRKAAELDPNAKMDSLIQIARCVVTQQFTAKPRDIAAAEKAYNEALAVAGPANETLTAVAKNLEILKKPGPPTGDQGGDIEIDVPRFARCLMNAGKCAVAERTRAVGELKKAGRDGVPYIAFALRVDSDPSVRQAARGALESLKGAACAAGGDLKLLATMECPSPCINCPPADVKRELELCDAIHAGRALGQRLVATCGVK
jgi:tetratricopeptide (TPR) repeat protein